MSSNAAPQEQQPTDRLTAVEAAAILRCLATAERLPPLNYGSVCRRALREHGGLASTASVHVEQAVVRFAAVQGSRQQQQYHLADLVAELLSPSSLEAASTSVQQALLIQLSGLLATLPETHAAAVLGATCRHVSAMGVGNQLQLPLMEALEQLLGSKAPGSPILQQAALHAFTDQLFPQLPTPGMYPLRFSAMLHPVAAGEEQSQRSPLSARQRVWAAALRCLQLVPREHLSAFLQSQLRHAPVQATFATAALVTSGSLDVGALQHPRNLLLAVDLGAGGLTWQQQGFVAAFISRAVATLPAMAQQQWLLDTLDACKVLNARIVCLRLSTVFRVRRTAVYCCGSCPFPCLFSPMQVCPHPAAAFQLAAALVASMAAAHTSDELAADHVSCAGSPEGPMHNLPFTLPALLASPAWRAGNAAAMLLQRLLAAVKAVQASPPPPGAQAQICSADLLRRCLLAARHQLPPDMWQQLAGLF
jgi:hypothetical protein